MKGNVTFTWITGILITALGALIMLLLNYQSGVNSNQATAISGLNVESVKQTALLIVIAEKDGIPDEEVKQILGISQQLTFGQ